MIWRSLRNASPVAAGYPGERRRILKDRTAPADGLPGAPPRLPHRFLAAAVTSRRWACVWMFVLAPMGSAFGQSDRLYTRDGKSFSGALKATDRRGVQFETGGQQRKFLAAEIVKILHEGDPGDLTRGRELALSGQYEPAERELKKLDFDELERDVIKSDAAFYLAYCRAKLALAGRGSKADAVKVLRGFASRFKDSWHFFDAAKLLGDLAMAANEPESAERYYKSLALASSPERKIESVYLLGMTKLKSAGYEEAIESFDRVINATAENSAVTRIQTLARAGKAVALAGVGRGEEGQGIVKSLIAELNPTDLEMAARIYNAQGASYEAAGDDEGALLAYLHTHLLFSSLPDAHAEALSKLADLWQKVGRPERAAAARSELRKRYPGAR